MNKDTKEILTYWSAKDHPCYGNGDNPEELPTPFLSPITTNMETILLDGTANKILENESKKQKTTIQKILRSQYEIDMTEEDKFYPRDIGDGKRKLFKKSELYTVRRIKLKGI